MNKALVRRIIIVVLLILAISYGLLISLNPPKHHGPSYHDSRIRINLASLGTQSELYADSHTTFLQFCEDKGKSYGSFINTWSVFECHDSEDAWAAGAILPYQGAYYCVDSKGKRGTTVRGLKEGETECPPAQQ